MKVGELITALSAFPHDLEVLTEGCDCYGEAASIAQEDDVVMIYRSSLTARMQIEENRRREREHTAHREAEMREHYPELR